MRMMKNLKSRRIGQKVLTQEQREESIVGYGILQRGACDRDGSLASYDHTFNTYEDAMDYYDGIVSAGYGDTISSPTVVSLQNEMYFANCYLLENYLDDEEYFIIREFIDPARPEVYFSNTSIKFETKYHTIRCDQKGYLYIEY